MESTRSVLGNTHVLKLAASVTMPYVFAPSFPAKWISSDQLPPLVSTNYQVKHFLYSFPRLPKSATKAHICDFLHRITRHGVGYSVYIPPFATMTHANHTGLWYPDLPTHCRDYWDFYDQVLHQALTGSAANLGDSDLTRHLVAEFSGYQIIWLLAYIAGHPGVSITVLQPTVPRQKRETSFHDYMQAWSHFLHLEHCRGIAYSDVYFVETWLENLHPVFNTTVKPLILGLLRDCLRDVPVPIHFSPEHLILFICSRAHSVGLYTLTSASTPASMSSATTSRRSGSTAPTRQLLSDPGPPSDEFVDVRLLDQDLPTDIYASICSLMAANSSRSCDLCQATNHMVASCPVLHRVIADPTKTRRVLSALDPGRTSRGGSTNSSSRNLSSTRARTPPRGNRTAPTRALELDADDTDDEATLRQLTDDENDSHDPQDQSPDFP